MRRQAGARSNKGQQPGIDSEQQVTEQNRGNEMRCAQTGAEGATRPHAGGEKSEPEHDQQHRPETAQAVMANRGERKIRIFRRRLRHRLRPRFLR